MPKVSAGPNLELHYYEDDFSEPWRAAPAILLQHGFSRNGQFWYNWVPLLSREFRVFRPDLRGMGRSAMAEDQYQPSLEVFVEDILRALDNAGVEQVVYVGESFGGIIGLKFAHSHPERIKALVLCNTPCRLPKRDLQNKFDAGGDWDAAMGQGIGAWSTSTIGMRLDTRVAPQGLVDWYISEMDRTPSSIGRKLQNYLDTLDFSPHLKEVKTPTLLLVGEESPTSTLEQQQFMAGELPNCRLEVYPGLGHGINVIHPEWCVQRMREFLASQAHPPTLR